MPGTIWVPAVPGWSAYRTSVVHSALDRPQVTAKYHRLGSMVSIAPDAIAALRVPLTAPGVGAVLEPPPPLLLLVPLVPPLEPHAASTAAVAITSAASPARLVGFR